MKKSLVLLVAVASWSLSGATASAAKVHLVGEPSITATDTSLTFAASLAGLGNKDIEITVIVRGEASVVLLNPAGNFVPGQNRVPIVADASESISRTEIKNGRVNFSVTVNAPLEVDPLDAGAPNANWIAFVEEVEFTDVVLIVAQGGRIVLTQSFSAD